MRTSSCFSETLCRLWLEGLTDSFSISRPVIWGCSLQGGSPNLFSSGTLQSLAILWVCPCIGRSWKDGSKHRQIALYIVWDPNSPIGHLCLSSVLSGPQTPCNPRIWLHICSQDHLSHSQEAKINPTIWYSRGSWWEVLVLLLKSLAAIGSQQTFKRRQPVTGNQGAENSVRPCF